MIIFPANFWHQNILYESVIQEDQKQFLVWHTFFPWIRTNHQTTGSWKKTSTRTTTRHKRTCFNDLAYRQYKIAFFHYQIGYLVIFFFLSNLRQSFLKFISKTRFFAPFLIRCAWFFNIFTIPVQIFLTNFNSLTKLLITIRFRHVHITTVIMSASRITAGMN